MKIQYYTASSLDGFIATEEDSLEWLFSLGDIGESSYPEFISGVGALAMGASTYEWLLNNADSVEKETGSPWPYEQPVWVFTHRNLAAVKGANLRFVEGKVDLHISEMERAVNGKNLWVVGGGDLAGQFYDAGRLDEIIVQIGAATLGRGKPLFPRRLGGDSLRLKSVQQMGPAMVELRYDIVKPAQMDP